MPVYTRLPRQEYPQAQELRERLFKEWSAPGGGAQPAIYVDSSSGRIHIFVVWDAWESLPQTERSEVIMDVVAKLSADVLQKSSISDTLQITVAMGLTTVEAERMGIQLSR